mmetsp:Transcript_29533/g.75161  ORF Transcript_29533/g.75161 Transcript_29533/m.75161 type:complete len:236 (-) Transcript_29533:1559-2266(-)
MLAEWHASSQHRGRGGHGERHGCRQSGHRPHRGPALGAEEAERRRQRTLHDDKVFLAVLDAMREVLIKLLALEALCAGCGAPPDRAVLLVHAPALLPRLRDLAGAPPLLVNVTDARRRGRRADVGPLAHVAALPAAHRAAHLAAMRRRAKLRHVLRHAFVRRSRDAQCLHILLPHLVLAATLEAGRAVVPRHAAPAFWLARAAVVLCPAATCGREVRVALIVDLHHRRDGGQLGH